MTREFINYIHTLPQSFEKEKQEQLLIEFFKSKDETIRKELIEHNLRLCAYITLNYCQSNHFTQFIFDMYSESVIALTKALETYNPYNDKHASFSTYAGNGINFALLNFYLKESKQFFKLTKELSFADDNKFEYFDLLEDEDESRISEQIIGDEFVKEVLNQLNDKNRLILKMYLGIDYPKRFKQNEIAQVLGISQSSISKTINNELVHMKKYIAKNYPLSFPNLHKDLKTNSLITKLTIKHKNESVQNAIFEDFFALKNKKYFSLSELSNKYKLSIHRIKSIVEELSAYYIEQGIYSPEDIDNLKNQRLLLFEESKQKNFQDKLKISSYLFFSYYGINNHEKKSQIELSQELNMTRQAISSRIKEYEKYLSSLENRNNEDCKDEDAI